MKLRLATLGVTTTILAIVMGTAFAEINRVRVLNQTDKTIYVHKGGYAPSVKIPAGQHHIFYYPFRVIVPNTNKKIETSLIVATSGGRWMTTPNGVTYLSKPAMVLCLDYQSQEHRHKTGNRVWTIKRASGIDKNCKIKSYHQPWYQPKP